MEVSLKRTDYGCEITARESRIVTTDLELFADYETVNSLVYELSNGRPIAGVWTISDAVCDSLNQFQNLLESFQEALDDGCSPDVAAIAAIVMVKAERESRRRALRAMTSGSLTINVRTLEDEARKLLSSVKR